MKIPALALVGVAAAAVLLVGAGAASADDNGENGGGVGTSNKVRIWRKLAFIQELDDIQRLFLMLVAYGEGKYNPAAHNGSPSERLASSKAADNSPWIVQRAIACGVNAAALRTGSWTTFQLLAPYVSGTAHEIFGGAFCPFADPTRTPSNLNLQIVIAIEHARDLQGYKGWQARPTVGNLRLGWAAPAWMGYEGEHADRIEKYRDHAEHEQLGAPAINPRDLIDKSIGVFPNNPAQIYEALRSSGPS